MTAESKQIALFYIGAVLVWLFKEKKMCKVFLNTSSQRKPSSIQVGPLVYTYQRVSPTTINVC